MITKPSNTNGSDNVGGVNDVGLYDDWVNDSHKDASILRGGEGGEGGGGGGEGGQALETLPCGNCLFIVFRHNQKIQHT